MKTTRKELFRLQLISQNNKLSSISYRKGKIVSTHAMNFIAFSNKKNFKSPCVHFFMSFGVYLICVVIIFLRTLITQFEIDSEKISHIFIISNPTTEVR